LAVHERHPLVIHLALAGALLLVLCAGMAMTVLALNPRPRTYAELVTYELRRRGVDATDVTLGEMWPDQTNLQYGSYAGPISIAVGVQLPSGIRESGWIECRTINSDCTLSLPALDVVDVPLPELAAAARPAWLRWIERRLAELS
jgi:hypothetical protein